MYTLNANWEGQIYKFLYKKYNISQFTHNTHMNTHVKTDHYSLYIEKMKSTNRKFNQ